MKNLEKLAKKFKWACPGRPEGCSFNPQEFLSIGLSRLYSGGKLVNEPGFKLNFSLIQNEIVFKEFNLGDILGFGKVDAINHILGSVVAAPNDSSINFQYVYEIVDAENNMTLSATFTGDITEQLGNIAKVVITDTRVSSVDKMVTRHYIAENEYQVTTDRYKLDEQTSLLETPVTLH
jgi:hypothetical protein